MKRTAQSLRLAAALTVMALVASAATYSIQAFEPEGKPVANDAAKSAHTVEDLAWMSGRWQGQIFGGPIDEHWQAPSSGVMMGMSRLGADRERCMYEFMLIEEHDGAPTMFLRHFRQHLSTRETEPMAYRLVELSGKKAIFESADKSHSFTRITYELEKKKSMLVVLEGERGGKPTRVESRMERGK